MKFIPFYQILLIAFYKVLKPFVILVFIHQTVGLSNLFVAFSFLQTHHLSYFLLNLFRMFRLVAEILSNAFQPAASVLSSDAD